MSAGAPPLVMLLGPTASGKTAAALAILYRRISSPMRV